MNPLARWLVRFFLVQVQFGLDDEIISSVSPMEHFESGAWGNTLLMLTRASSEFLLPWANRQADIVFQFEAAASAARHGGSEVIQETVQGCHFSYIRNVHALLDSNHRFWRVVNGDK